MRGPIVGFLLRFAGGWLAVLALVTWFPAAEQWAVRQTVASLAGAAAVLRIGFQPLGAALELGGVSMQIVPDCTPLMPTAALWIAIVAFPAPWRLRVAGMAIGALALWFYNLLRILALVPVLRWRPEWFDFIHVYLWQTVTLLVVFALFLAWLRPLQRTARPGTGPPAPDPAA